MVSMWEMQPCPSRKKRTQSENRLNPLLKIGMTKVSESLAALDDALNGRCLLAFAVGLGELDDARSDLAAEP